MCVCVREAEMCGHWFDPPDGAYILSGMWESGQRGAASPLAAQSVARPPARADAGSRGWARYSNSPSPGVPGRHLESEQGTDGGAQGDVCSAGSVAH